MNIVDAASKEEVLMIHRLLETKFSQLYADIWKVGCNMGLRIGDLLALKFADLDLSDRSLKLIESKTSKKKTVRLNTAVIEIVSRRRNEYPDDIWLFQVHSNRARNKPVSQRTVSKMFKEAGDMVGLTICTHSMRKSRGMAMFNDGMPIEKIAMVLNHKSINETMRYLGISQRQVLQTYDDYLF